MITIFDGPGSTTNGIVNLTGPHGDSTCKCSGLVWVWTSRTSPVAVSTRACPTKGLLTVAPGTFFCISSNNASEIAVTPEPLSSNTVTATELFSPIFGTDSLALTGCASRSM